MGKHLVLAGGGHAHMATLENIGQFVKKGHRVSVVGPSRYHYYSGMGPGMLGGVYSAEDIRFHTKKVVEQGGGTFVLDRVVRIDAEDRAVVLESGGRMDYDVLSCNTGSFVPDDRVSGGRETIFTAKPIERLMEARSRLKELLSRKPVNAVVAGGGPAALEIAGNVWRVGADEKKNPLAVTLFCGKRFLGRFSKKIRSMAEASFRRRGITMLPRYVETASPGEIIDDAGERHEMDILFFAHGVRPSTLFADSGLPMGPDGGLMVNRFLQCVDRPEIFGGGDCIYFKDRPLDKVGVYAVRQNPVLLQNLMAAMEGKSLIPFNPGGGYLLIFNLGDGTGILKKWNLHLSGRPAFWIKDRIDKKFMKRFQAAER